MRNPPKKTNRNNAIVAALLAWFCESARDLPWRRTQEPYAVWISEIMLQQTQVKTVIPYWERWMQQLPNVARLANAPIEKVLKLWEGLGYYTRARNLHKAAQVIIEKHNGDFPRDYEAVLELPGIGRYTAGAICSIAFDQPTPILDGNVIRVLTRLFAIPENPRDKAANEQLWSLARTLVEIGKGHDGIRQKNLKFLGPLRPCSFLNQSLMELGALICTPRQPQCSTCPIQRFCIAYEQNAVERFPNVGPRAEITEREFVALIAERDGRFLVRQRAAHDLNGGLWEFPNIERKSRQSLAKAIQPFQLRKKSAEPLCEIKHSITRYRISLKALPVTVAPQAAAEGVWLDLAALDKLAFPSAHRKILRVLQGNASR